MPSRSRRLATLAAFLGTSSLASFGCSLIVDTSGLSQANAEAGVAFDSAAGGAGESGSVMNDAANDAASATDAGSACDATFCDDFDHGPLGATWTRSIENKGTIDFATKFVSPPNALRARFFGTDAPDDRYAMLERELGMGMHVRCDFSLYVSARANKDNNDVFRIRTRAPGISDYLLYLIMPSTGGAGLADDIAYTDAGCACPQNLQLAPGFDDGVWRRITVETDFTRARMSVDGVLVVNDAFGPIVPNGPIVVGLGGRAYSSITSDTLFDDFSCTLTP